MTDEQKAEFSERSQKICSIYQESSLLASDGTKAFSVDEKTGIQALEFKTRDDIKPGFVALRDSEYVRHGTKCLIGAFDVASGKLIYHTIEDTRTEEDYANFINNLVEKDVESKYIIIADQLNTHKSATLVKLVAKHCGITNDLGKKGKSGILKNMDSRQTFLEDESHKLRFAFTPKHSSWLNQIEIWFGILTRKLLKRLTVSSTEELTKRINDFIEFFNQTLAHPFKWNYAGKVLCK